MNCGLCSSPRSHESPPPPLPPRSRAAAASAIASSASAATLARTITAVRWVMADLRWSVHPESGGMEARLPRGVSGCARAHDACVARARASGPDRAVPDPGADERSDRGQGAAPGRDLLIEQVPGVDHVGPDLEP